jgi:phospholipid/cholesterol/gamma-HCH transport system substrate-binding protein
METKPHYFVVGLFVSITTLALIVFGIWLASGHNKESYHIYYSYFTESVTGLNVDAVVRYRGVAVGKVSEIKIDKEDTSRIRITMEIADGTPVKKDTVATLKFQGITGVSYVDLTGGSNDSPLLDPESKDGPAIIRSSPSQLDKVVNQIPLVVDKISAMADRLSSLADEKTVKHLSNTLANIDKVSSAFGNNSQNIETLIRELTRATQNMAAASENVSKLTKDSQADTREALQNASKAMREMAELLEQANGSGLKETQSLMIELKKTARDVQALSREIKDNPSAVLSPTKENGVRLP